MYCHKALLAGGLIQTNREVSCEIIPVGSQSPFSGRSDSDGVSIETQEIKSESQSPFSGRSDSDSEPENEQPANRQGHKALLAGGLIQTCCHTLARSVWSWSQSPFSGRSDSDDQKVEVTRERYLSQSPFSGRSDSDFGISPKHLTEVVSQSPFSGRSDSDQKLNGTMKRKRSHKALLAGGLIQTRDGKGVVPGVYRVTKPF